MSSTYWSNRPFGHDPVGQFPVDGVKEARSHAAPRRIECPCRHYGRSRCSVSALEPVRPPPSARSIPSPSSVASSPPVDQPVASLTPSSTVTGAKFSAPGSRCPNAPGPCCPRARNRRGRAFAWSTEQTLGAAARLGPENAAAIRGVYGEPVEDRALFPLPPPRHRLRPRRWGALPDRRCTVGPPSQLCLERFHCPCNHACEFGLDSQPVHGKQGSPTAARPHAVDMFRETLARESRELKNRTPFAEPAPI